MHLYENEGFGDISMLSYQKTTCHHQNYGAYSNYECPIHLMDHFLILD